MLFFARNSELATPEAIFTGRFIFLSPTRFTYEECEHEASKVKAVGIDTYLKLRPESPLQKAIFEEVLHSVLNRHSSAYQALSGMRYAARWKWMIGRNAQLARSYYVARTLYFSLMNPYQEQIASQLEHELNFSFAKLNMDRIRQDIESLDLAFWRHIEGLLRKSAGTLLRYRRVYAQLGSPAARPPSIILLRPPPYAPDEVNLVLGKGHYPSDWEMGLSGNWRTAFKAKLPITAFIKRFRSPEFYRRNSIPDDVAWMKLKFDTERQFWPSIIERLQQEHSTIAPQFERYRAMILGFAADWASIETYSQLLQLEAIADHPEYQSEIPERVGKAITFFYLHEN